MHVVGTIDVVALRVPLVQVDAPEIHHPQQRRHVVDDRKVDDVAVAVIDGAGADPFGTRRRRALHEEERPRGAVRIALHHHRAVADVRKQHGRNIGVVLDQAAFRDAALRPERLAQVRQANVLARDGERRVIDVGRAIVRRASNHEPRSDDLPCRAIVGSLIGSSFGGRWPCRAAPASGTYSSSRPAVTQRSIRPPRLMSPRPTKCRRKHQALAEDRQQQIDVLARRDAAEQHDLAVGPDGRQQRARAPARAARGRRRFARSMSSSAKPRNEPSVTGVSAARRPAFGVITEHTAGDTGSAGSGGRANRRAYASLPRKYRPLTKLKTSPSGAPSPALQLPRERERARWRHHHPRADAAAIGGRQQEDARQASRVRAARHSGDLGK